MPDLIILTGIAAARPESQYWFGDVTIAKSILDYGEQKYTVKTDESGKQALQIEYRSKPYSSWSDIRRFLPNEFDSTWYLGIDEGVKRTSKTSGGKFYRWPPSYHFVTVASGDFLVNSGEKAKAILNKLSENRQEEVDVLEMEAGGIGAAIERLEYKPKLLCIKGISDFADEKKDTLQPYAANSAAVFIRTLIKSMAIYSETPSIQKKKNIIATLNPNPGWENILSKFPYDNRIKFKSNIVDGALEVLSCPSEKGPYGGIRPPKIKCEISDFEWPYDVHIENKGEWLKKLSAGLVGDKTRGIIGWLEKSRQGAKPNRIRILLDVPRQPTLDDRSLYFKFGNSDYFNYRAVHSLSFQSKNSEDYFSQIFPLRWSQPETPLPGNCAPYHVSAQGIIICKDPITQYEYLILSLTNPGTDTAVKGWEATMSEQMWAPAPNRSLRYWWEDFILDRGFDIDNPTDREGDTDITKTLIRGLKEEFKLEQRDFLLNPPLLGILLEQDLYFLAFIYLVYVFLSPQDLYSKRMQAKDRDEIGGLAAYQFSGHDDTGKLLNGANKLAELIQNDKFSGSKFLVGITEKELEAKPWHPTSRMRIYMAGCHLYRSEFDDLVNIVRL
jgi:nucleoside phosphorylase